MAQAAVQRLKDAALSGKIRGTENGFDILDTSGGFSRFLNFVETS
ncbi:MAG TPA: hypothetical protein VJT49_20425 [Amycolatopsis sp.]|nr:hypothetical protein [Amycolatopsis sp.]HKS47427.1 hypothetical protein [Amycolatopsis sp.]